ncbi:MAG TPA: bifunctional diguanylate cyclase/phosphodiesterase, partial [Longimicrobiales bacterium]|nr:bifunctional diguanylate cyclase/phosphodiesterase [Longimicrobiales bacterium]
RFGGDEFVLLCEDVDSEAEALEIAERTLAVFDRPFTLAGAAHRVTASIGVAIAWGREAPDAVLRDADSAMYRAKDRGRARFELFDEDMRARALDRLATEVALNGAAERGELRLFYQPVVKAGTGEVVAAEALLRWERPGYGLVAPSDFIPVAEQSGQILELGEWVLRTACAEVVRWNREDLGRGRELGVTVNLSARQLSQPGLVEMVARTMEETGLTVPWMLGLEITESVLMEDIDAAAETLTRLGELGVMLVLDDFGAGYSSLAYVKRLPLDVLKLDRSFSDGLTDGGKDVAIVAAVSAMAQAIGVRVVAEGIETAAQAERANELGCGYAQGYWYARPMAPEALSQVLGRPLPLAAARA